MGVVQLFAPHPDDVAGDADHGTVGRHLPQNHGIGRDLGIVPHLEGPQHLGAGTDHHVIADGGVAFAAGDAGTAQGGPLVDQTIVADLHSLTDHHAAAVVDDQTLADPRAGVDFNTGGKPGELGYGSGCEFQVMGMEPMGQPVLLGGVKAAVEQHDLPGGPGRGVVSLIGFDGFADRIKHTHRRLQGWMFSIVAAG